MLAAPVAELRETLIAARRQGLKAGLHRRAGLLRGVHGRDDARRPLEDLAGAVAERVADIGERARQIAQAVLERLGLLGGRVELVAQSDTACRRSRARCRRSTPAPSRSLTRLNAFQASSSEIVAVVTARPREARLRPFERAISAWSVL